MGLSNFLGWIGATISTLFYISPSLQFYKLWKKKIKYNEINSLILIVNYFSCIIWLIYGYSIKCIQIEVSNGIGAIVNLAWSWIYAVYLGHDHINLALFFTMGLSAISFIIYILLAIVINKAIGQVCLVLCSLSYLSMSKVLFEVFRTKNYQLIQIYSSILNVIGCAGWSLYGLLPLNFVILVPNLVGFAISLALIMIWRLYKGKKPLVERVRDVSITQNNSINVNNAQKTGLPLEGPNIETNNDNDIPSGLEPNNNPLQEQNPKQVEEIKVN